MNENTPKKFCDIKILSTKISKKCNRCNLNLLSDNCAQYHKLLCNGRGNFGWFCDKCNRFTYKFDNSPSEEIKSKHQCGVTFCRTCRDFYGTNENDEIHLCPLRKEQPTKIWPSLAFLDLHLFDSNTENCSECYEIKKYFKEQNTLSWKELFEHQKFPSLFCETHMEKQSTLEPLIINIYKEHKINKGLFSRIVFSTNGNDKNEDTIFKSDYCEKIQQRKTFCSVPKLSQNQESWKEKLENGIQDPIHQFLLLLYNEDWTNTTFIIADEDCIKMVRP
jgi:hypothetical protein